MASQAVTRGSAFLGSRVAPARSAARPSARPARIATVAGVSKKVNTYDDGWKKGFFGSGYFVEDSETVSGDYLRKVEKKKLLSFVESAGLLSKAEKAGITLSKVEKLGLLSTAERLGLLSLAEEALVSEPGKITSLSIPFFVAMIAALVLIPGDPLPLTVVKYATAAVMGGGFLTFFAGGFLIAALQEE